MEHVLIMPIEPFDPEWEWYRVYLTGRRRREPYKRLERGDVVYVKRSSGDYVMSGIVSLVYFCEFSTMGELVAALREEWGDPLPDHPYYSLTVERLRAAREAGQSVLYCSAFYLEDLLPIAPDDAVPMAQSHHPWVILDTDEKRRAWLGGYVRPARKKARRAPKRGRGA